MKKALILLSIITITIADASAQDIELTGFYGYSFNGKLRTYYGTYRVQDNPNYGGILSIALSSSVFVDLSYNRTDTRLDYYRLNQYEPLDISTEYYQIGALQQIGDSKVRPFATITLGMARMHLKQSSNFTNTVAWRFAPTLGAGTKVYLSDRIGLRLQARLGLPMQLNGMFVSVGTGGASTSVGFEIPIVQFDLSGGLIIRL
jgi:hypothetical protein